MKEQERLLKNTGIIAIGNLSTKLVSFLLLPLYTAILTESEYGIFDYIISLCGFCSPFISMLMEESMFRFLIDCKTDKEKSQVISVSLFYILAGSTLFFLISLPIMWHARYEFSAFLIMMIFSTVMVGMISALLRGIGRTDQYTVFNFLISSVHIILNVILIAVFHWGIYGMLISAIGARALISVLYIVKIKVWKYISFRNLDFNLAKRMLLYSLPLIPNKLSWTIINLSDRIIIMNAIGSAASGLYAVSYKFPNLMDMCYGFFYQSWKESSARVVKEKGQEEFYNGVYFYLKKILFSLMIGLMAFMPLIFRIMVDEKFSAALIYVPLLLLGVYYSNISGFYGGIFTAYMDTNIMGITTVAAAVINLGVNLLLVSKIGLFAAAISTLVSNFAVYLYRKIKVRKYIKLRENKIRLLLCSVVLALILVAFYSGCIWIQLLGCVISVAFAIYDNWAMLADIAKVLSRGHR